MTTFPNYSTGTVSVAANGTTVTGVGTIWSGVNARPGDILQIGNFQTIIDDVTDTTHLAIPTWGGGLQSGVAYKIWQTSPLRFAGGDAMVDVSNMIAALNTNGFFFFVDTTETEPDPSYGNDGQYAFKPTTGETWAKSGGVWVSLGIFKAFSVKGAWSGATAYTYGDVVSSSGSSYVCILAHTNQVPPNATYWALLASKGDTGATGATGATGTNGTNGTNGAGYGGTSATSLAIAIASKVFTTQAGLAYQVGNYVRASSAANGANYMEGYVTAYSSTSLTINVTKIGGSGTFADWSFAVSGAPGSGDLLSTNNLSDVVNKNTSFDNLSLKGSNIASAATVDLESATGSFVNITGSTGPITAITLSSGHKRVVYFASTPTLTAGASLVLLNGLSSLTVEAGAIAEFVADGTVVRMVSYQAASSAAARALIAVPPSFGFDNASLAVSASASALTISLKDASGANPTVASPSVFNFRNVTPGSGAWSQLLVTAATSLVVSSGSTLGVTSSNAFRLWVVGFNDAGTFRLGVIKVSTPTQIFALNDTIPASSTAEGGAGAADNAGVIYTGTAVSSKSFLILGYIEWNSSGLTAGTWTTTNLAYIQTMGPGVKKPGDIVQTKTASTNSAVTVSASVTLVDSNLSVAITPQSAANLVRVSAFGGGNIACTSTAGNGIYTLARGSTAIGSPCPIFAAFLNNTTRSAVALSTIDFPNSNASTTYKVRLACEATTGLAVSFPTNFNPSSLTNSSTMIVEELMG